MFSMFSISLQYAVLAAGCATVAQGDSRPVLSGRFHLYCPSQCAAWAEEQVAPRVHHLQFPTSGPLELFNQWFVGRALAADVLSLSLATKGSRGATRDVAKAKLLTTIHGGLSFGRLLLAYRRPCWPIWFRVALQAVPGGLQSGLVQQNLTYLLEVLSWVQRPPNGTAVYCVHAGLYIGKANLRRSQPGSSGLAVWWVWHLYGGVLDFYQSRGRKHRRRTIGPMESCSSSSSSSAGSSKKRETKFAKAKELLAGQVAYLKAFAVAQRERIVEAQASTEAPLLPGSADSPPLNQTQLDQIRNLLSEFQPKQPEQAPHPPRVRGQTKNPPADGSADVSPWQKALVASWFCGHIQLVAYSRRGVGGPLPVFGDDHYPLFLSSAATRTPRLFIPRGWRRWKGERQVYDAAQQVDKFLASCGLRTATRAVLGKVFCVGSFLSEESSPAWYSATVAVGAMISKWLLALQSGGAGGPPRFSTGGHASGTGAQSTCFGGLT